MRRWVAVLTFVTALGGALAMGPPAAAGDEPSCPPSVDTLAEGWICAQYNGLLFRVPSDGEIAFWSGRLATGGRLAVSEGIVFSAELVDAYVGLVYDEVLLREADPAALAFWRARIVSDRSELGFEAGVFRSAEFIDSIGNSAEIFVDTLYGYYFGRPADPGGLNFWAGQLGSGARTVDEVIAIFQSEVEAGNFIANVLYGAYADRPPDSGGFAFWSGRARQVGLLGTTPAFIATDELFAKFGEAGLCGADPPSCEAGASRIGTASKG